MFTPLIPQCGARGVFDKKRGQFSIHYPLKTGIIKKLSSFYSTFYKYTNLQIILEYPD